MSKLEGFGAGQVGAAAEQPPAGENDGQAFVFYAQNRIILGCGILVVDVQGAKVPVFPDSGGRAAAVGE